MKIAFGSKARSGKDTAADFLAERYGGQIFKFATAIYEISRLAYERVGVPFKKDPKLLQFLGTEWGRSIDTDIWVKACLADISLHEISPFFDKSENIFLTDARFTNEADALKKDGFLLVRIERSALNRGDIGRDPNHPSEIDLDNYTGWDYVIDNNGTLEEFHSKIDELYNEILGASSGKIRILPL